MQGGTCRFLPERQSQRFILLRTHVHASFHNNRIAVQAPGVAVQGPASLALAPPPNRPFIHKPKNEQKLDCYLHRTDFESSTKISTSQPMQDSWFRASGCKQHPAMAAAKQCIILGAAALCAAPLLLILDVAEQAASTLQRLRQLYLRLNGPYCKPTADVVTAVQSPDSKILHQSQQQLCQAVIASKSSAKSIGYSNVIAQPSSQPQNFSSSSSSRQHRSLLLPDLWPPFGIMLLAVLPLLILIVRHAVTGSKSVLQPLLWCAASFLGQGYLNLILAALQRRSAPAAAVVAHPSQEYHCIDSRQQPNTWEGHSKGSSSAAAGTKQPTQVLGCAAVPMKQLAQQQQSSPSVAICRMKALANVFTAVQLACDVFRFCCMCLVAWWTWYNQAAAVLPWAKDIVTLSGSAWHTILSDTALSLLPAKFYSSSLSSLQHAMNFILSLTVDVVGASVTAAVYALACAARLLSVHS